VEITSGEGFVTKLALPPDTKVLAIKMFIERERGIAALELRLFSQSEELKDTQKLGTLLRDGAPVQVSMLVDKADAQQVVPELSADPSMVLGDADFPTGVAYVPARPDWVVTSEYFGHCVKITNIKTGEVVCKFGENGEGEGQMANPWGVAVTSDSSFVLVVDVKNNNVVMLRLVTDLPAGSAHLEFVRTLGEGKLCAPAYVALPMQGEGIQQTMLVTEFGGHQLSEFTLDGTSSSIFAGTGSKGDGDGELDCPCGIAVLGSSGDVAVADWSNHRVQVFSNEGKYKYKFGIKGEHDDGQLQSPTGLASDGHGNLLVTDYTKRLQVFSHMGKHLCTRTNLGIQPKGNKGVAWCASGGVAIANSKKNEVLLWEAP
jgi:DNA-binding beta-propeller fold protein YncE